MESGDGAGGFVTADSHSAPLQRFLQALARAHAAHFQLSDVTVSEQEAGAEQYVTARALM